MSVVSVEKQGIREKTHGTVDTFGNSGNDNRHLEYSGGVQAQETHLEHQEYTSAPRRHTGELVIPGQDRQTRESGKPSRKVHTFGEFRNIPDEHRPLWGIRKTSLSEQTHLGC